MSRRRNFARTLTAAFLLAVATALLLLPSAPGHAQTTTNTYVSNIDQGDDDDTSGTEVEGQRFTTGSQSGGYDVTHVDIGYDDAQGDKYSAGIYTVDADGYPDSEVFALTAPTGAWAAGTTLSFTAPANSTLAASTTYTVRMVPTGGAVRHDTTTSSDEDSGAFSGWSIQDAFDVQISSGWIHSTSGEIIRIAIKGTTAEVKFVDFSDLQADHTSPIGMWSPDGSTLWVGQWFSTQVYAYNLADETANYSENWTLHNPATVSDSNRKPTGIWSNGTHIYVTDPDHGRVFQYNFGDKSLTSTTYSLHADNGNRQGLWSDGTTAWVSDNADDKLYAYQLSDFGRQSGKDIDLHSDNGEARGIWSDGTTIWVLDSSEEKIYAYLLSDGSRVSGQDIGLDGAGVNYNSIWSDGATMYVVENTGGSASRDPQIHKLPLPAQDETVVWEATLALARADTPWSTVGNSNEGYGSSASPLLSATHGTLTPDSFTVGSTTHTVEILAYQTGSTPQLFFFTDTGVTKADLEGLELRITVDGVAKTLAVSSATDFSSGGINYGIYWEDSSHGYRLYDWAGKTVIVQLRTPVVDDCAGDTTTTCSVSLGSSVTGDIELVADTDYFSLSVTSGVTYQIDAEGSETSMGTLDDPYLILRDASDSGLASDDDGGDGRNARIVWAASSTRTVYVEVNQVFHDSTGTYTLTVSVGPADDCANNTTTTCSVSPGTPVTGDIQYSGDDDYFSLSVASGVTYQIDAEGSPTSMGTLGDPSLELRDPSNPGTAINDDGGTGFNARLTWTAISTGTVYVVIRSADGGTGTYTLTVSVSNNPATGAPTISGTAQVGQTLTAATSGIMDSDGLATPGYTYQWIRVDGGTEADISGATSSTYTLVVADQGKTIKVKVSFTDDASNAETLTSAATSAVAAAAANTAPDAPGAPRVAVSATDVRAITVEWDEPANNGAAITDYDVQYQRDDETVWHNASHTGTGRTVTISNLLLGYGYRVQVRATNSAGTSAWSASGSGATESNTAATGKPTISGTLLVGETLTVDTSGISDADGLSGVSYAYQWRRDGADITGANSMTYTLAVADAGAAISVEVSFTDGGSFDEVLTSDATTTVAAANNPATGAPTITGTAQVGQTLTAATSGISDADGLGTFSYQWKADGADISGATSATYTLTSNEQGKMITVTVSFTDAANNAETLTSTATAAVTAAGTVSYTQTTEVWSATLTSANSWAGLGSINYDGYGSDASQFVDSDQGSLSPNSFTIGATTHKVEWLAVRETGDQALFFFTDTKLGRNELAGYFLEFTVDGVKKTLQVSDATDALEGSEVFGLFWRHAVHGYGASDWQTKTISVRLVNTDDCANNTTTTCSVSPGSSVTGDIQYGGDDDSFCLSVTSGFTYQIDAEGTATSMGTLGDPYIGLRDASGTELATNDDGGTGYNARITWTADRTGTVYVRIESAIFGSTGTYTLTVSVGIPDCGRSHWDRNKSLATQLLDASCEYQARSRNILADGQVSAQELAEIRPLVRRLREIVDDLPCGSGPHRYYDPAGEQKMWKGPLPECLVRTTKSGGGGLPWNEILLSPASEDANSPATGVPSISGTAQVGETLTADTSGIADEDGLDNAAFIYQWLADDADIQDATGQTYTLSYAELDKAIRVRASFTDDAGHSEELTSAPTSAVALPPWSENLTRGRQPNALFAEANDAGIWLCWFAPEDAADEVTGYRVLRRLPETGGSFAPYGEDLGSTAAGVVGQCWTDGEVEEGVLYAYRVKAIRNHRELSRWSRLASARATVTPDTGAPANTPATGLPAITGTAQVGETLTADTSGIADEDGLDNAVFSYQWLADGAETQDATDATYTPVVDDVGKAVSVTVSFTDDAGNEEELTSAATDAVEPETEEAQANNPATGLPTISGIAQVGVKLTADLSGIADEDGVTNAVLAYQWQADGADIPGETLNCYTPDDADEGKTISVRVTFTDDAGHEETLTSAATDAVEARPNRPATGVLTITGTARVGELLTADVSSIGDADGLDKAAFSYQWQADSTDLSGATGSSYTLAASDEGKAISVTVSFTDYAGHEESFTSTPTAAVVAATDDDTAEPTDRPHGLTAEASDGAVVLTWTAPVVDYQVSSYHILRHRPEQGEAEPLVYVDQTPNKDTSYTDTDVEAGVLYVYRVKAIVNWMGDLGDASDAAQIRMQATSQQQTANSPATGAPAITGTAQVGETLTADTSGIADADGLSNASFAYQWQADGSDISGATDSTHTLANADIGKVISLTVSFTDDAGNDESLTSGAAAAVEAAPLTPLTGVIQNAAASHDGESVFTFELRFSEEFGLSYKTLRDHAFTVNGGRVTKAQRLEQGSNIGWRITVSPDSSGAVTIILPITEDCEAQGAICTEDGRKLSTELVLTVSGPGQ